MESDAVSAVVSRLEDLDWCVFAGAAVAVYADGQRAVDDFDVAVVGDDLYTFADRVGAAVARQSFAAGSASHGYDGFEAVVDGVEVDVTGGFPPRRVEQGTFRKIIDHASIAPLRGVDVPVAPVEDVLIQKATMDREKDVADLRRLAGVDIDQALFDEFLTDWGVDGQRVRDTLRGHGFDV